MPPQVLVPERLYRANTRVCHLSWLFVDQVMLLGRTD
jgi:hypothetical protein